MSHTFSCRAAPLIVNGPADHVHLLLSISATTPLADLLRVLKTNSSRWVHEQFPARKRFGWQAGYGAFTVSASRREDVRAYIAPRNRRYGEQLYGRPRRFAVWKRRAEKGDIVLKRGRNRVLVLNSSSGVWQITRETLRYAHKQYQRDERDYSVLPARLRPPAELNPDETPPDLLTTYAGLLFRDLLDRSGGNVQRAVGAYNGGLRNPNLLYAEGVDHAARHARVVVEQAAVLGGHAAAELRFMSATP